MALNVSPNVIKVTTYEPTRNGNGIKTIAAVKKLTVYGSSQSKEKFCVIPRFSKIP